MPLLILVCEPEQMGTGCPCVNVAIFFLCISLISNIKHREVWKNASKKKFGRKADVPPSGDVKSSVLCPWSPLFSLKSL